MIKGLLDWGKTNSQARNDIAIKNNKGQNPLLIAIRKNRLNIFITMIIICIYYNKIII